MIKKIFSMLSFLIIVSSTMNNVNAADTLDYSNKRITDDKLAITADQMSIRSVATEIGQKDLAPVRLIDLSNNLISSDGAIQFLRFIWEHRDNLTALQAINLSGNQIRIFKEGDDFNGFVDILISVLEIPSIEQVTIARNPIGSFRSFADIRSAISRKVNDTDRFLALTSKIIK